MVSKYRPTKDRASITGRHKNAIIAELEELKSQKMIDGERLRALEEELASVDDMPDFLCEDVDYIGRQVPPPTPPRLHPMAGLAFVIYLCELWLYKMFYKRGP